MKNPIYNLFQFSILLLFLQSMFAWFLWGQLILAILVAVGFSILLFLTKPKIFVLKKSNIIPIIFLILIQLYVVRDMNINAFIAALLRILILSIVLLLKNNIKIDLINFITKSFAIILAISTLAWIIFLLGIPLPHFSTNFNNGQYYFDNYFFFIDNVGPLTIVRRFSSIFLEPGQLGMITAFLLCVNRFDLKRKSVLVIFIATLLTLSLAAYVLLIISASVYFIFYSQKPLVSAGVGVVILLSSYLFFVNLNSGNNLINQQIIQRLEYKDGDITGNNRFSKAMDEEFDRFIKGDNLFLGNGTIEYIKMKLGANAGYKVFIIQHGIIGTFLLFAFYFSMVYFNSSKMAWVLLVVYILCFMQAAYALWECEILIFITAVPFFKSLENKIQFKDKETKFV